MNNLNLPEWAREIEERADIFDTRASDCQALLSALNKAMEVIADAPHGRTCARFYNGPCHCWKREALEAMNNPQEAEAKDTICNLVCRGWNIKAFLPPAPHLNSPSYFIAAYKSIF